MAQTTQRRIILKIWREGNQIHDNLAEINAYLNTNEWRVACTQPLLSGVGEGACYILFLLEKSPPEQPERRILLKIAPDATGVARDNMPVINAYLAAGWAVTCADVLLQDPGNALCYVLYLFTKPGSPMADEPRIAVARPSTAPPQERASS
jgi:hypothetical protein